MRLTEGHCSNQEENPRHWKEQEMGGLSSQGQWLLSRQRSGLPNQESAPWHTLYSQVTMRHELQCPGRLVPTEMAGAGPQLSYPEPPGSGPEAVHKALNPLPGSSLPPCLVIKSHIYVPFGNWTQQLSKAWAWLNVNFLLKHSASKFRPALRSPWLFLVYTRENWKQPIHSAYLEKGVLVKKYIFCTPHDS